MTRPAREALRYCLATLIIFGAWTIAPAAGWENTQWNSGVKVKNTEKGFNFTFPTGGHVNSVERSWGSIPFKGMVTFTCKIKVLSGKPKFVSLDPAPAPPALLPNARVLIQRRGDDWMCGDATQNYRWWSTGALCVFLKADNQIYTYSVKLTPENWTNCWGKSAKSFKAQFQDALKNADNVQIVFGGGNSFSHGLRVKNGSAQFQLLTFSIK